MKKILGFTLVEVVIAAAVFSLTILILARWVVGSLNSFSFDIENVLNQTQNFSAGQTLQLVPDTLSTDFEWTKNSNCRINLANLNCARYELKLPDGSIFFWYQYER